MHFSEIGMLNNLYYPRRPHFTIPLFEVVLNSTVVPLLNERRYTPSFPFTASPRAAEIFSDYSDSIGCKTLFGKSSDKNVRLIPLNLLKKEREEKLQPRTTLELRSTDISSSALLVPQEYRAYGCGPGDVHRWGWHAPHVSPALYRVLIPPGVVNTHHTQKDGLFK